MVSQPSKIFIFDLDGTIADTTHREHFLADTPKDWDGFHEACVDDTPKEAVVATLLALYSAGFDIRIFTGRSEITRLITADWLWKAIGIHWAPLYSSKIRMRREHDFTPDFVLKLRWYRELLASEDVQVLGVFEDRARVAKAWRDAGVTCFQVAEGNF